MDYHPNTIWKYDDEILYVGQIRGFVTLMYLLQAMLRPFLSNDTMLLENQDIMTYNDNLIEKIC